MTDLISAELTKDFQGYFNDTRPDLTPQTLITALIGELNDNSEEILDSTRAAFPDGHINLTQTLVELISQHGVDLDKGILNEKALNLLKDSRIYRIAHLNNHALVYQINKAIRERKAAQEAANNKNQYSSVALARFMYYVEHPHEEMKASFEHFFDDIDKDEELLVRIYNQHGKNKWDFSNTLYKYYHSQQMLGLEKFLTRLKRIEDSADLSKELTAVAAAHAYARNKTQTQAKWMAIGGFAFGMEIAMLALENLALMSNLGAWGVLGISFGASLVFGTLIAIYFHTAHYQELKLQNQRDHYQEHFLKNTSAPPSNDDLRGIVVAKGGTYTEAGAVATVLGTLGVFAGFDMVSLGILGGKYESALPGWYFVNKVLLSEMSTSTLVIVSVIAAAALALMMYATYKAASSLKDAHLALDGEETKKFFNKQAKKEGMGRVINKETTNPLFFSRNVYVHDAMLEVNKLPSLRIR